MTMDNGTIAPLMGAIAQAMVVGDSTIAQWMRAISQANSVDNVGDGCYHPLMAWTMEAIILFLEYFGLK